jgi:DNA-binding transcriptional ArsR family regulator
MSKEVSALEGRPDDDGPERQERKLAQVLKNEVRKDILRQLLPSGATVTADDLESDTLTRTYANYHLTQLEEAGAIEVAEAMHEGNKVIRVFRATAAGRRAAGE